MTTPRWAGALRLLTLLLLLALAPAAIGAEGERPTPEVGIRLAEAPTDRQDDPRASFYVIDRVAPGGSFTRRIEVANGAAERRELLLYVAPATISGGDFTIAERGVRSELVQWLSVVPSRVSLAPRERATVQVRVDVPAEATEGEYYGAVVAERPAPVGDGIGVALRAGVRIYLSVGPGGEPASDFRIDSLQAVRQPDGRPAVLARVNNTGGRALDLSGQLALSEGPGGLSGGPFPAQLGTTLAPGQTAPVTVPLDAAIRGGPWLATLTLKSGLLERRAEARVTFPDESGEQNAPVEAKELSPVEDPDLVIPFAIGLLALLFLALIVTGYLTSRRKARERAAAAG